MKITLEGRVVFSQMEPPMEKSTRATQAFALYCFLIAVYLSVGGLLQYRLGMLGISINEIFLLAVPGILYAAGTGLSLRKAFPLRLPSFREILLVLLMTALVIVPIALLIQFQEKIWPLPESVESFYQELMKRETVWETGLKILVLAVIPAICEELFFRGLLQGMMVSSFGKLRGVLLTALFFAIAHVNPWYFLYYLLLGVYLGWLRDWRGNLALCIFAHLANNIYSLYS